MNRSHVVRYRLLPALLLIAAAPASAAVKKTIAVAPIEVQAAARVGWMSGEALHAQLISELTNSGRYRVVERENIEGVLGEQDLATAGRTRTQSSPKTGDIEGAQMMIKAVITDAEQESGKDSSASIMGIGGGAAKTTYRVTMDLRIYDTQTSLIMETATVTAKQVVKQGGVGVNLGGVHVGGNRQKADTTGAITRDLIQQALSRIDTQAQVLGWKTKVLTASGDKIIIKGGTRDGLEPGMRFTVWQLGDPIIDDETGEVLDQGEETRVAEIRLTEVKEQVAYAAKTSGTDPQKGQIVKLLQ